jgi:inosose dehydratase
MPATIGYAVLPWEMQGGFSDEALIRGFSDIRDAGFDAVEVLAATTLGLDYGRRNMKFIEWPWAPETRSDFSFTSRMATAIRGSKAAGLKLTNIFCDGEYINPHTAQAEFAQAVTVAHICSAAGVRHLLVTGGPRRPEPEHTADVEALAEVFSRLGAALREVDVQLCVHPHIDTALESPEDIDTFFTLADRDACAFGFDTAHVTAGGGDAVELLRKYVDRVRYVHIKDIKMPETVGPEFAGPRRFEAFCDLGHGSVDFPAVWAILTEAGFDGPAIVELDSTPDPAESARIARQYVSEYLGA